MKKNEVMRPIKLRDKRYLGDGAFVCHDGYHVWLITHDGHCETAHVALEPQVLSNFLVYVNELKEKVDGEDT